MIGSTIGLAFLRYWSVAATSIREISDLLPCCWFKIVPPKLYLVLVISASRHAESIAVSNSRVLQIMQGVEIYLAP